MFCRGMETERATYRFFGDGCDVNREEGDLDWHHHQARDHQQDQPASAIGLLEEHWREMFIIELDRIHIVVKIMYLQLFLVFLGMHVASVSNMQDALLRNA